MTTSQTLKLLSSSKLDANRSAKYADRFQMLSESFEANCYAKSADRCFLKVLMCLTARWLWFTALLFLLYPCENNQPSILTTNEASVLFCHRLTNSSVVRGPRGSHESVFRIFLKALKFANELSLPNSTRHKVTFYGRG